jgi:hypothetical protein
MWVSASAGKKWALRTASRTKPILLSFRSTHRLSTAEATDP